MTAATKAQLPQLLNADSVDALVSKLSSYFSKIIETPHTFEELRTTLYADTLKPLVQHLTDEVHHPGVMHALLIAKGHYITLESEDDRGINATRGLSCELIAWRFITHLSKRDAIDHLCADLPEDSHYSDNAEGPADVETVAEVDTVDGASRELGEGFRDEDVPPPAESGRVPASEYRGMTALEIAAVTDAKKFLAQQSVQQIINGIWNGEIVFWKEISQHAVKQAEIYNPKRTDPFCRLRVPLYLKAFEFLFFAAFLTLYYFVLVEKTPLRAVTPAEVLLYIWIASFIHNEFGELWDSGLTLYSVDFWSLWDVSIIAIGLAFFICRMIAISSGDRRTTDIAFDILSLEGIVLVPRRTVLIAKLKPILWYASCVTKDFIKFLGPVAILYIGFNTTFAFLARGTMSVRETNWTLIQVFFGSSYLGFGVAEQISPILGPPLMLLFVCLTNILLVTSLISLLSNSLTKVMEHARDEYLFVYSIYVLEASTSNRLTYFLPPTNLLALLFRPMRLIVPADSLRAYRIVLLKATHWPFVGLILAFESGRQFLHDRQRAKTPFAALTQKSAPTTLLRRPQSTLPSPAGAGTQTKSLDGHAQPADTRNGTPSAPNETVQALQQLADGLRTQLHSVEEILEVERSRQSAT
nr:hypothetical protein B0A51_01709 [Rachicladosporium sp. CCFEE 5018]